MKGRFIDIACSAAQMYRLVKIVQQISVKISKLYKADIITIKWNIHIVCKRCKLSEKYPYLVDGQTEKSL